MMGVPETIYDAVLFQDRLGSLSLTEDQLCHHTAEKVSVLGWKKVVKRQVTTAASTVSKPMFKLILKSGTEAIFQMEDRVSLEVLRDDLGERLKSYRKEHPEEFEVAEFAAVNKTRASFSDRRGSTPYSMSVSNNEHNRTSRGSRSSGGSVGSLTSSLGGGSSVTSQERVKFASIPERRDSTGGPAFRRTYSGETNKYSKTKTGSTTNKPKSCLRRSVR